MLPTISIAAPAYNEAATIYPLVCGWARYLEAHCPPESYEIVICDDGSLDETGTLLRRLAEEMPCVRPCAHAVNQGAAAALTTAIRATSGDWILLLDADGQYPIENLAAFLAALERDPAPAYIGHRRIKEDSAFARFGSWASGGCCNLIHGTHYRDFNCALKFVEGGLLRGLSLEALGLNYSTEISSKILERGVAMREVEIVHLPRAQGRSTRTLWRGSAHRFLFVLYLGWRRMLLRWGVLQGQTGAAS